MTTSTTRNKTPPIGFFISIAALVVATFPMTVSLGGLIVCMQNDLPTPLWIGVLMFVSGALTMATAAASIFFAIRFIARENIGLGRLPVK